MSNNSLIFGRCQTREVKLQLQLVELQDLEVSCTRVIRVRQTFVAFEDFLWLVCGEDSEFTQVKINRSVDSNLTGFWSWQHKYENGYPPITWIGEDHQDWLETSSGLTFKELEFILPGPVFDFNSSFLTDAESCHSSVDDSSMTWLRFPDVSWSTGRWSDTFQATFSDSPSIILQDCDCIRNRRCFISGSRHEYLKTFISRRRHKKT